MLECKQSSVSTRLLGFELDLSIIEQILAISQKHDAWQLARHTINALIDSQEAKQALSTLLSTNDEPDNQLIDKLEQALIVVTEPRAKLVLQHVIFALTEIFDNKSPCLAEFDNLRRKFQELFFNHPPSDFDSMEAVSNNDLLLLKLMLSSNSEYLEGNVLFYGRYSGEDTCLDCAQKQCNTPMITLLLEAGVEKEIELELNSKKSAIGKAAKLGNIALFEWMVKNGKSPNKLFYNQISALSLAAENRHIKLVEYLLEDTAVNPSLNKLIQNQLKKNTPDKEMCDIVGIAAYERCIAIAQNIQSTEDAEQLKYLQCMTIALLCLPEKINESEEIYIVHQASLLLNTEIPGFIITNIPNQEELIDMISKITGVSELIPLLRKRFSLTNSDSTKTMSF